VVDAHAHESVAGRDVVDPVRDRLADGVIREVVDVDQLGLALRLPLPPAVFEVPDQLLLLRVDGDQLRSG